MCSSDLNIGAGGDGDGDDNNISRHHDINNTSNSNRMRCTHSAPPNPTRKHPAVAGRSRSQGEHPPRQRARTWAVLRVQSPHPVLAAGRHCCQPSGGAACAHQLGAPACMRQQHAHVAAPPAARGRARRGEAHCDGAAGARMAAAATPGKRCLGGTGVRAPPISRPRDVVRAHDTRQPNRAARATTGDGEEAPSPTPTPNTTNAGIELAGRAHLSRAAPAHNHKGGQGTANATHGGRGNPPGRNTAHRGNAPDPTNGDTE